MGLIYDIPTCAEPIDRIERDAKETLAKTTSPVSGHQGQAAKSRL